MASYLMIVTDAHVIEAIHRSDMRRGKRRRLARAYGNLSASQRANVRNHLNLVASQSVHAAVDWDAIIAFLKELIPLIIELIGLFG